MHNRLFALTLTAGSVFGLALPAMAEEGVVDAVAQPGPALTIYNGNFGVVRERISLNLKPGENRVRFSGTTAHVETDSVILRDVGGKSLRILEQNYRADAISESLLLSMYEGKTIDFETFTDKDGKKVITPGLIVRSGYTPHYQAFNRYGNQYAQRQMAMGYDGGASTPVVKVDGKLVFGLPGKPIFPALTDDSILKPALDWTLASEGSGAVTAELGYITGGMSWAADYNIIAPAEASPGVGSNSEKITLIGWVTLDNQSGKGFENAQIKLMAGDVNKLQPGEGDDGRAKRELGFASDAMAGNPVSEKAFDELHLYTLNRKTTLRDRETKQVEFVKAENVAAKRLFIYDGAFIDPGMRGWDWNSIRQNKEYGSKSNPKVWVMREFKNSAENGLGVPLPKGTMRFYRSGDDGQLEFTGENTIDHTPKDELVRVYTGNAFDIVGERKQTNYEVQGDRNWSRESFEIKVRNHKKEAVEVVVVEHLYRWNNWEIEKNSMPFTKTDSQTIEFKVMVKPDAEAVVTYTAHYSW